MRRHIGNVIQFQQITETLGFPWKEIRMPRILASELNNLKPQLIMASL
jgi:hypothetical protein